MKTNFLEQLIVIVKKNIKKLVSILIVIIILLFIFLFNQNLQEKNKIQVADKYVKATILIKQKKTKESKLILEDIIKKNHQFYSPLALYLLIDNGIEADNEKIINFFDIIIKNSSIDEENLNLIKIKKAIFLINIDNEELIVETLNPIINRDSVWKDLSIKLISEYFLSKDQKVKANEYLQLLEINNNK